jgi:hypothetical protein
VGTGRLQNCDHDNAADDHCGDCWDYVAIDPENRLVVSALVGRHSAEHVDLLVADFRRRTNGQLMNLMTSDENPAYVDAILNSYGEEYQPRRRGRRGRKPARRQRPPKGLLYATVHKTRAKNRVVKVEQRLIFGTLLALAAALVASTVSAIVNTVFVERYNGTDRNRNARKARKTYCFSKDWAVHEAVSYFTIYSYNFCWSVRTLREKDENGKWQPRTPAMAAGLTDHPWSLTEWLRFPGVQHK